jgi:hypothetical protein
MHSNSNNITWFLKVSFFTHWTDKRWSLQDHWSVLVKFGFSPVVTLNQQEIVLNKLENKLRENTDYTLTTSLFSTSWGCMCFATSFHVRWLNTRHWKDAGKLVISNSELTMDDCHWISRVNSLVLIGVASIHKVTFVWPDHWPTSANERCLSPDHLEEQFIIDRAIKYTEI